MRRQEHEGGPALLYVTSGATSLVVLAITLLAVIERLWMVGIAFVVLVTAIACLIGFLGLMLTDSDGDSAK